ncbi:MAG: hypothetical protein IJA60_02505 [Clostridia bacterium]|nr:hypothetical protein [Clostridia bacterium]
MLKTEFKDIDGDGYLTVSDALVLLHIIVNIKNNANIDFNGDGQCNLLDVIVIFKSIFL